MSSVLSDDESRLVKITAKVPSRGQAPSSSPRKKKVRSKKIVSKSKKVKSKALAPSDVSGIKSKGSLTPSDAIGIRSKAELGDNLQSKKIVNNPPKVDKPVMPKSLSKPAERYNRFAGVKDLYTRIAGMPEHTTIEPLAVELERDQGFYLSEYKPVLNEFGQFSLRENLEQGIMWNDI